MLRAKSTFRKRCGVVFAAVLWAGVVVLGGAALSPAAAQKPAQGEAAGNRSGPGPKSGQPHPGGSALSQDFVTPEGFTLKLPASWVRIPGDFLRAHFEKVHRLAPQMERQTYEYGFQEGGKEHWLEYPYFLVQVKRTGKIPPDQLQEHQQIQQGMGQAIDEAEDKLAGVLSQAQLGQPVFDSDNKVLWTTLSAQVAQKQRVKALIALKLTNYGAIQLNCYAPEQSYPQYQKLFQQMVLQMTLPAEMGYDAPLPPGMAGPGGCDPGRVASGAGRGAIFGGVAGGVAAGVLAVIRRRRRKKKTE